MKRSKAYKEMKENLPEKSTEVVEAVKALKEHAHAKFDETVELHIHLGINIEKSDQIVRGDVVLPNGTPSKKKIAVFVEDKAKQETAKKAGASIVGGDKLIAEIEKKGSIDADICIAEPAMMPKVAKIARILGPKGIMPNPKTGTVTPDIEKAIQELNEGKVSYKMDQTGNIHEAVGKISWEEEKIAENISALIENVKNARTKVHKGEFIKSISLKSTMSPAIKLA